MKKEGFKKHFATLIVILLLAFLLLGIYKFANGFFGGILLYVILLPFYKAIVRKGFGRKLSAIFVVLFALFVMVVPLLLILGLVGNGVFGLFQNEGLLKNISEGVSNSISKIIPYLSKNFVSEQVTHFKGVVYSLFLNTAINIGNFAVNLFIALFLLYYMLIQKSLFKKVKKFIPFNEKHSKELIDKLKDIAYSTIFVSGIIALIQGTLLTVGFLIFGVQGAFLWGFVAMVVSFIPMIGTAFVWVPALIIQFLQGEYFVAGGILLFGAIISSVDNLIRPFLGNKISKIHPLTTALGIFIGVFLFGVIGIFVGPLLVAFSVLILKMFREEYYN